MSTIMFIISAMAAVGFFAFLVLLSIFFLFPVLYYRRKIKRQKQIYKKTQGWKKKVESASRLLVGNSWRDPAGKEEFVRALYGNEMPDYLWYLIGFNRPTEEEFKEICQIFWDSDDAKSENYSVIPHKPEANRALVIRHPKRVAAEITVGGKKCPLYQLGSDFVPVYGIPGNVSFVGLYSRKNGGEKNLNFERIQ